MTLDDISDLLAVCAQFDGRTVKDETPKAWLMLLGDIPAEDAAAAVREHYRTDRRWIMPADIVAHHEKLEQARRVEYERLHPPGCWGGGCGVSYVTSKVEGSRWAYPDSLHADGCRAMRGMLHFSPHSGDCGRWGIMPDLDPATFDEIAWENAQKEVPWWAAAEIDPAAAEGRDAPDWASRLAVAGRDELEGEIVD